MPKIPKKAGRDSLTLTLLCLVITGGCSCGGGGDGARDGSVREDVPFVRPPYTPMAGTCGFTDPAFCETFEDGPSEGGRSGELDPNHFSVVRGMPYNSSSFDDAFRIGPALIGECRDGLSNTRVLPDADVLVCDPVPGIGTRHALATAAAQNYGLSTYRIRQPFDFSGRTGTIKIDLDLSNDGLGGWPAIILGEDPSAAPSFDWEERGSGPRNGISIELMGGFCSQPNTIVPMVFTFADYEQTSFRTEDNCDAPHGTTAPGQLNHVEIYVTQSHVEVWASSPSADGVTFESFALLWEGDVDLPFTRGYVSIALRNHATMKYWRGSAATLRFDNVGFDGPVVSGWREYSAPDSLVPYEGLPGCMVGGECRWEGDVIAQNPDSENGCGGNTCSYADEGRSVGYVVPDVAEGEPPVSLTFSGVDLSGMSRARLSLAAVYPTFDWAGMSHPPTAISLRYRVNGGAWHERFVSEAEENAFTDFNPSLGGAGAGAGLLNQIIDLDIAELQAGSNTVEIVSAHTWTGTYRVMLTGVDLLLD